MSVRVTLNCSLNPERYQQLIPFLEANLPNVRSFPGNLRVSVLFDDAHHTMLLDEDWVSEERHRTYLRYIEEKGVLSELATFMTEPPQIRYFKSVDL